MKTRKLEKHNIKSTEKLCTTLRKPFENWEFRTQAKKAIQTQNTRKEKAIHEFYFYFIFQKKKTKPTQLKNNTNEKTIQQFSNPTKKGKPYEHKHNIRTTIHKSRNPFKFYKKKKQKWEDHSQIEKSVQQHENKGQPYENHIKMKKIIRKS